MSLFYQPELDLNDPVLPPDESRHCVRVLRQRSGDAIEVIDGQGNYYQGVIQQANPKQCSFTIVDTRSEPKRDYQIHLAIAPTKNLDRTEWLVEKAVEIGVDELSFVACAHSERRVLKSDRLIRKAVAAMKQSGRATLPKINALKPLARFLSQPSTAQQRLIAYVDPDNPQGLSRIAQPQSSYEVLIGPEGGFSEDEIASAQRVGLAVVSLGAYRLRTETAGIVACTGLHTINQLK